MSIIIARKLVAIFNAKILLLKNAATGANITEQTGKESGIKFVNYKTNNPGLFWTMPK